MKSIRFIFCLWLLLGNTLFIADIISYYKLMYSKDWFQLINRDLNVVFIHIFIVLPFTIMVFILIKPINKLNN
jgi:hypothetical protein